MKKWKKFIAMGLAVSMIVPSCIPQTLWASEFSAGSVESAADVFEDGAGYETGSESGNKISDENNSGDEFGTGELKDQEPEQSETEDSVNAGQSAEGYNILLYSDGKLEKTYVIPYADADTAKVPEALRGKTGYIFKEWNTKEDGTGETYKPGDSIKKLLETADMAKQAQETSERTEAGEEIKPEKDVMQEENDVAQTDSASWEEKTDKAEMQISDTENDGTSPDISTDKAIAAGDTTAITLYAIWEKASEYKITYKLNKGKNNTANPKTYTSEDEIKFKKPTRSGYHFVGWYTDSKYKNQISVIEKGSEGSLTLYAKWTKEISPSAKAASLDYVKGTKANTITVSATVSNYVKSSNGYYLLTVMDPSNPGSGSSSGGYTQEQAAFFNLIPDKDGTSAFTDNLVLIRKEVNGVYYEGLVMDAVNIQPEQEFKISIGAVNNIGRSAFDGNLRIALVGKNGTIKEYISEEIPVKYPADSYHSETDCFCKITLPIKAGDRIRVYYKGKYSEDWEYLRGGSLLKSEIILKEEDMPLEKMTSFAYDKKNKKISLKTCPQVEYQVLSLTNNVVFSGITNDDNPEIRIDTSELIDREYVIVLRKKIEDEDEYEEKRIRFAIGNQNKK